MVKSTFIAFIVCLIALQSCKDPKENPLIGTWVAIEENSLGYISSIQFLNDQECIIYMDGMMAVYSDKSYCTYKQLSKQVVLCDNSQGSIILNYHGQDTLFGKVMMMNIKLVKQNNL